MSTPNLQDERGERARQQEASNINRSLLTFGRCGRTCDERGKKVCMPKGGKLEGQRSPGPRDDVGWGVATEKQFPKAERISLQRTSPFYRSSQQCMKKWPVVGHQGMHTGGGGDFEPSSCRTLL
eukprot:363649-Chlamydomonas_euryale.AAC.3